MQIVYLSGRITGNDNYLNEFACAERFLKQMGYIVLNPAEILKDLGELSYEQCLQICYRLLDIADIIFMVSGWNTSKIANAQLTYAKSLGKRIMYQDYFEPFRKVGESDE